MSLPKTIVRIVLLISMSICLTACGGSSGSASDDSESPSGENPVKLIVVGNTGEGNLDQLLVLFQSDTASC